MVEALTDFIKNAGLFTLLHFLITAILIFVGIALFAFARTRRAMMWFLIIGILPVVSGILTMFLKNRILDSGIGMFGRLSPEGIAAGRREALVDLVGGFTGGIAILLLRAWRQQLIRKANG
jgi:hypothetical protein